jgi:starch synthase
MPAVEARRHEPTVGLVTWGLLDEVLDSIDLSLEQFCAELPSGWLLGYITALRQVGVRTVLFCVSSQVERPTRLKHPSTNTTICLLPATGVYRGITETIASHPGPWSLGDAPRRALRGARHIAYMQLFPYRHWLGTPLLHLARELRRERCEAILCDGYETARFDLSVLLGRVLGRPVFASYQLSQEPPTRLTPTLHRRVQRIIHALAFRGASGLIIAPSEEAQRVQAEYYVPTHKIRRIFNPLNPDIWRPISQIEARSVLRIPAQARVAVWHGRAELHIKGLDVLLDAWDTIVRERPAQDVRLMLIGTGTEADALRDRLESTRPRGVQWIDEFISDRGTIRRYLSAADVYAFPSRFEGFPVAPLEAMACGLPVVAADASGVPDIFDAGEASGGQVVPRGDAEEFARALGRALDDPTWTRRVGPHARRRVETGFGLEAIGQQLRDFMLERRESAA